MITLYFGYENAAVAQSPMRRRHIKRITLGNVLVEKKKWKDKAIYSVECKKAENLLTPESTLDMGTSVEPIRLRQNTRHDISDQD